VTADGWQGPRGWTRITIAGGLLAVSLIGIALGIGVTQPQGQHGLRSGGSSLPARIQATRAGILRAFKSPHGHGTGSVTITATRYPLYTPCATASCVDRPAFTAARAEWLLAPYVAGSADQGIPVQHAIDDLRLAAFTGESPIGYASAIRHLRNLLTLPDAMVTPAERAQYQRDDKALDAFFHTPNLLGPGTP
jgi:hypothetical protein